jgi:hypothetical protein
VSGTDWNTNGNGQEHQELEAALRRALRRLDAPEGFAARMAALAEAEERSAGIRRDQPGASWWHYSSWGWKPAWGGMAALLVAGVLTGHVVHERHTEAAARAQASREFDVSMQITDKAMEHAREQLRKAGVGLDGEQ